MPAALKRPVQSSDPASIGSIGLANNAKVALTELDQCLQSTIDRCQRRTFLSNFQEVAARYGRRADQEAPTSRDHRLTRVNLARFRSELPLQDRAYRYLYYGRLLTASDNNQLYVLDTTRVSTRLRLRSNS